MLGDDIAAALPELRAQAESTLTDSCELQRKAGRTIDPTNGMATDTWTTYATVPCKLRDGAVLPSSQRAGEQDLTGLRLILAVPVSVAGVRVGDRAVLSGLTVYISGVPRGTHMVLQRLDVTEDQT